MKIKVRSVSSALTVRRTVRRNSSPAGNAEEPDHLDAHIGQDGIKGCCELSGPVADEELELGEVIAEVHRQVADLLGGPPPSGFGVASSRWTDRLATSRTKNT